VFRVTFVVTNVELVIVHKARFLQPLGEETAAGEGVTLFGREIRPNLAVFQNIVSAKPQEKPVKNPNREKDSASNQEPPESLRKASEDVSEPSCCE
jgi:hypothetical protein